MLEFDIELKLADRLEQVAAIVQETIQKVYSHYYPSGAVRRFVDCLFCPNIRERDMGAD